MLAHIEHSTEPADLVMTLQPDPDTPVLNGLLSESELDFAELTTGWPFAADTAADEADTAPGDTTADAAGLNE